MPLFLQYIGFIISIFGFFITILTFIAASRVNKKIKSLNELKDFHVHKTEILNQLEGFVPSIVTSCKKVILNALYIME